MKLKVQKGDFLTQNIAEAEDITYVYIAADDGTPIMIVEQVGRDHVQATKATDPTFRQIAHRLGIRVGEVAPL